MVKRFLQSLQQMDWLLLLTVLTLFAFGMSAIYSVELSREAGFPFLYRQLTAFGLSILVLLVVAHSNYLQLRHYGRGLYLLGLLLLVLVLFFGATIRGTTGWFLIGPFSFQPVEFMKIALVVELARYFGDHARRSFGWREILGGGFLTFLPVALTMMQPDLGSATLLLGIWVVMMFFAGLKLRHGVVMLLGAVLVGLFAWGFILQDYQKERVEVFLQPELDALGSGYNITQAKIAIGSGQWLGRGLGFGSQSQLKFLPESQTDFVFAVIAEELGFVGICVVFFAIFFLLWRILHTSSRARDHFSEFLSVGIFAAFFVQSAVNIGVNLAILPATGVSLPFVSYGGSSLLMSFLMIGIIESQAVRQRPGEKNENVL